MADQEYDPSRPFQPSPVPPTPSTAFRMPPPFEGAPPPPPPPMGFPPFNPALWKAPGGEAGNGNPPPFPFPFPFPFPMGGHLAPPPRPTMAPSPTLPSPFVPKPSAAPTAAPDLQPHPPTATSASQHPPPTQAVVSRLQTATKKNRGGDLQTNLKKALYQDEKYTLHEPVWKVVGGQMTRLHFIETSPSNLPITKFIATSKKDAVAIHQRVLEKSTAAIYYSDGSFKHGWAWGAAVEWVKDPSIVPEGGKVGKMLREELGMCDPTDAEMGGMRKALEAFSSVGKLKEEELIIFSDSQAAITLIDSGIRYQSQLFTSTLERTLTLHPNVKVTLVWVPGHVGIAGNELADRTAVSGSTTTFLARRAGRLPGVLDAEGDMPVILSRRLPKGETEDGEVKESGRGDQPTDDSLVAGLGSLFVARFPEDATANDLEVLFGQFGKLSSIDIFSIPPMTERFAMLSFVDPSVVSEAIKWLDDKPVTLPTRYAATRDCEVWKGWQGSLKVALNEVGKLVPSSVADAFPSLPEWAKTRTSPEEIGRNEGRQDDEMTDEGSEDIIPHSGHGEKEHPPDGMSSDPSQATLAPSSTSLPPPTSPVSHSNANGGGSPAKNLQTSPQSSVPPTNPPSAPPPAQQPQLETEPYNPYQPGQAAFTPTPFPATFIPPTGGLPYYSPTAPTAQPSLWNRPAPAPYDFPMAPPHADVRQVPQPPGRQSSVPESSPPPSNRPIDLTASERFLINYEQFPPGPGNKLAGGKVKRAVSPKRRPSVVAAAPYPPTGAPGRPTFPPVVPPGLYELPPIAPAAAAKGPSYPLSTPRSTSSTHAPLPTLPPVASRAPAEPVLPTNIADMSRMILDLTADNTHLDAQHARLTLVAKDPADWSLALAQLAKSILREQEVLEAARLARAKEEDQVIDWENVLQRNHVGIEERRSFVLDVLDVLDASVLNETQIIPNLRRQIQTKTATLVHRMTQLPPTTAAVLQSCEDIFRTLHQALEEQKNALDEAARRSSVLGGLVQIRRDSAGLWRGRKEEIGMVVRQLTQPPAPPPPPVSNYRRI